MFIHQSYAYAMLRPLQQAIRAQGGEVCWFLATDEVDPGFLTADERRLMSVDEVREWQPHAVLVPGNVVPSFIPGIKVGVFHGFNSGKINSRGREDHFEIRGCFDLYCTQGPNTTAPFIELAKQHGFFDVVETGWANLDPLFTPCADNPYLDASDPRPTLLFCSTFSQKYSCAKKLVPQIEALRDSGKWRILVQFHPKMEQQVIDTYKGMQNDSLTFVETDNVIPLLQAADLMLCDTSSMLLMFLLQQKPVVTFNTQTPQPHLLNVTEPEQIAGALDLAHSHPAELMAAIETFSNQLHPYRDGRSTERVLVAVNNLIESGLGHLKSKPLNLIRRFKQRKSLGYWRW
ncbi:CDP-glycerol glycerophosphotransferase, TagB/SpsB family [Ferrimonas sediminum]|uniref:CDP-glycerol glycerophosphotransferase, TagB/SpsB family n=1 Tax=Ferrimonas sediminum TaxID=718193 RepID=A0A1G8XP34_9GAMM|nr:CDP-glycerol glycerophosphotransferase family protein [Ferrimonas sediminum]SDJ92253.1 CDP-glycerol glycerophosphotransferase, TagB/SpsB family [Ferrimonas sediminum]